MTHLGSQFPGNETAPTVVPDDVIARAAELQAIYGDGKQGYSPFDIAVLAIMAERERCQQIAQHYADSVGDMYLPEEAAMATYGAATDILRALHWTPPKGGAA